MFKINSVRHLYPEPQGFMINRENGIIKERGLKVYTLLHFHKEVELLTSEGVVNATPGACIVYTYDEPQYFKHIGAGRFLHDWMHFFGDVDVVIKDYGVPINKVFYPDNPIFITKIMQEMEAELLSTRINKEKLLELKWNELFLKLGREALGQYNAHIDNQTSQKLKALRSTVFSNLDEDWTVEKMANVMHLSQSRFFAVYKSQYGCSPVADLIRARIDAARIMLETTNKTIAAVASSLNYKNLSHFMRQFKRLVGMTPNTYRRNVE